jgi:transcriptional regulator GlxA family with amidase domain
MENAADTRTVTFLRVEGVAMMSLASAIEPLRSLNRLINRPAWRWRLASLDGKPVMISNGIPFSTEKAEDVLAETDMLFVCGGVRIHSIDERRYLALLRKAERRGIILGALSTGPHLLARAGLLDGYRCTIHWENRPAFQEQFPHIHCTDRLYELDRDRFTCSGGTAALDMMLHLIAGRHGGSFARRVANQFHHERIRDERDNQKGGRLERLANVPAQLRTAVNLMQQHTEHTISIAQIADRIGMSVRQLERLFHRHLEVSPARYYLTMRIERAREYLLYSDWSILEVAVATGFTSTSHFSHWFKRVYGVRPSQLRGGAPDLAECRRDDAVA